MSDTPAGAWAPTPSSQAQPPSEETPTTELSSTEEQSSSFPKEEAEKFVGSNTDLHPIQGDPERKAEEFEEQKKADLDAEREEHMRRREGGGPQEQ